MVFGHAGEDLTACDAAPLQCPRLADLLERTQHRHRVGAAGNRRREGVPEQLPRHVERAGHDHAAQEACRHAHDAHEGREHRRDARQTLDQQVAADAQRLGVHHAEVLDAVELERHRTRRGVAALDLADSSEPEILELEHQVAHGEVVRRHVDQHRGVLDAAGDEVHDGLVTAHKLLQMRTVLQVADADRRLLADDEFGNAVAHAVVGDVVVLLQQLVGLLLAQSARLHVEVDQVAVVLVVDVAHFAERVAQHRVGVDLGLGGFDVLRRRHGVQAALQAVHALRQHRALFSRQLRGLEFALDALDLALRPHAAKVERVVAHALATDRSHVERHELVGCVGATCFLDHILALENAERLLQVSPGLGFDEELLGAVTTQLLHTLGHTVRDGLGGEVHPLVVHAQVVHRLQGLRGVRTRTLKRSFGREELVDELRTPADAKEVVAELVDQALLFADDLVGDACCGGHLGAEGNVRGAFYSKWEP